MPSAANAQVAYELRPVMVRGELSAVVVTVRLRGGTDGRTVLELPDDFAGEKERWRRLDEFHVAGARMQEDGPARRILRSAPGARITVRYRVKSAYDADPTAGEEIWKGPVIRPTWFYALGEFVFVKPAGREMERATFRWTAWPKGWTHASDADHWRAGQQVTIADVLESTLLSGPDVQLLTRPITGGTMRLAARGEWPFGAEHTADLMARVLSAQRSFWGDVAGPFTVSLIPFPPVKNRTAVGGTGRTDGFALFATTDVREENLLFVIAHEHIHTWVPRRLGRMPEPNEIAGYWFSEGFTDFYTQRTLLRTGVWTLEQFVADVNRILADYATSPVRNDSNSRIVAEFWNDRRLLYLPYRRGALFAYLVEHELRRGGAKASLDSIVFAMRDRWAAAPANNKPMLLDAFLEETKRAGEDMSALIATKIVDGEDILLPEDQFPGCARVETAKPEGTRRVSLQTVILLPLSADQKSACARSMSGALD